MPLNANFVAAEDGLEDGPKFLTLARLLKGPRSVAFWCVMRLRRLVKHEGDALRGALPKSYAADDIAAFLEWTGRSAPLISALKATGWLGFRRGRGFFIPEWEKTTTGRYLIDRERILDADRKRKRKAAAGDGGVSQEKTENPSGGIPAESGGAPADSMRKTEINQGKDSGGSPPDPPPPGGTSLADARWQWVLDHAENPQNPAYCKRILAGLSDEDWALVQKAWGVPRAQWGPLYKKNARILGWGSDAFLRKHMFLRWRPKPPAKPVARASAAAPELSPAEALEKRLAETDAYVMSALADPDLPEEKKRELREKWRAKPENAERVPPWKKKSNGHHAKGPA